MLHECDVHTLLRLPTGIFYAQGVKANVLFFDRKPASERPWTQDASGSTTCAPTSTSRSRPTRCKRADLDEFVACYHPANRQDRTATWSEANPDGRWRSYAYDELVARDKVNLDIFWLRDEAPGRSPASLEEPDVIAAEIIEDLQAALDEFDVDRHRPLRRLKSQS